jgi:hypothetical protein
MQPKRINVIHRIILDIYPVERLCQQGIYSIQTASYIPSSNNVKELFFILKNAIIIALKFGMLDRKAVEQICSSAFRITWI